ncbi:PRC-barrel domain-containing protein [Acidovorax sp. A1169]|uniref:PRC-barrel domain-containing protein n=1 Tax=Acidovorax sp. A1169 TaxID=3059524 RepID=UPI0027378BE7|nr:PRC-barrel domain-containing protein [Acidovorax sp. A1169]MDP4076379.1 PRC-barrel domain-containing protein [Acidovorax sp. A1169]
MLRSMKDLKHYTISATDGQIGRVNDLYFDDHRWAIRYLVVDAGSWLTTKQVLISPISLHHPNWSEKTLSVSVTREQVKNSPGIDTEKPVSRQNEEQYLGYYGYPSYWGGAGIWGEGLYPYAIAPGYAGDGVDWAQRDREMEAWVQSEKNRHQVFDPHLRSCNAVNGYQLHATDGEIGHVTGYLIDDETWSIRYVIVDTSNWWLGNKVVIAPEWITGVHWGDRSLTVSLSRESVKYAPAYDPEKLWDRELDVNLYRHYGRAGYWSGSPPLADEI